MDSHDKDETAVVLTTYICAHGGDKEDVVAFPSEDSKCFSDT